MKPLRPTHTLIKRLVPAIAVWAVGKVLETPKVKARLQKVDQRVFDARKRATRRASGNSGWMAAGATAIAVGIGLMAKASRK